MSVIPASVQYHEFLDGTVDQSTTWIATTAAKLIIVIVSRAYVDGAAGTRTLTVTWDGIAVPVVGTNFNVPAVAPYDIVYWVGELSSPSTTGTQLRVQSTGTVRSLNTIGLFVDGAKSLGAAAILRAQARDVSGNTVTFSAVPNTIGAILVNSSMIAVGTTITSFDPSDWTIVQSGISGKNNVTTSTIRYGSTASLDSVSAITQFGGSSLKRGGVLVEIQSEAAAAFGVTEAVSAADSVGPLVVATTMGLTEALSAGDGSSLSVPSNTSPENPVGVWAGAAASWKLPSGADSKGVNTLTVSGLSAATIKGPGATFTTVSYARRTAPSVGSLSNLTVEFWCKPTAAGQIWYAGPRAVAAGNVARIGLTSSKEWTVVRASPTATHTGKSTAAAVTFGQTYHVAVVFASGANPKLYVDGAEVELTFTGSAITGSLSFGSDDEIAIGSPTGGIDESPPAGELPEALRTITVTSAAQLTGVLSATSGSFDSALTIVGPNRNAPLRAGDHILCTAGTYAGTFTLSAAGTSAAPIAIKAASLGPVVFSGLVQLQGAWAAVQRLKFTGNARKVDINKADCRVTRCLFDSIEYDGAVYLTGGSHPRVRIDYNEFRNIKGAAIRCELNDGRQHQNMRIDHNYFNGHDPLGDNESVIIILTDAFHDTYVTYEYNLFSNCMRNNTTGQDELITVKTGAPRVRGNTVVNCNNGVISLRETNRGLVEANWFENGSYIKLHGDDHTVRNNRSTGKLCEVRSGDAYATDPLPSQCTTYQKAGRTTVIYDGSCKPAHCGARNTVLEHNIGMISVGRDADVKKAVNTTLSNNDRAATRVSGGWTGITETGIGGHVNTAVKLAPADVGPLAGL